MTTYTDAQMAEKVKELMSHGCKVTGIFDRKWGLTIYLTKVVRKTAYDPFGAIIGEDEQFLDFGCYYSPVSNDWEFERI